MKRWIDYFYKIKVRDLNKPVRKIHFSVINDLLTEQRVDKVIRSLMKTGAEATLTGRKLPYSTALPELPYKTHRFWMLFTKGPLFYACFNFRLFCYLLPRHYDILVANDLDTLLANFLVSKIKKVPLVYDSHEYFTEVPELVARPRVKMIWEKLESWILPKIRYGYTVSPSITETYNQKYKLSFQTIRNVPPYAAPGDLPKTGQQFPGKKVILYQGAINLGRGVDQLILSMKYLPSDYLLLIVGNGDEFEQLKQWVDEMGLARRALFTGRVPKEKLMEHTVLADLGVSLEEDLGLNYRYALPNKLFAYIQARVPVLVSPLPEMKKVVEKYRVGEVLPSREPREMAKTIADMFEKPGMMQQYKENTMIAAKELCWENEEKKLLQVYENIKTGTAS